ncbi:AdoMet-dependent rRNA methyltransferase spb1 [Apiospora kogelbergensis]|uniref:AdoMet-dependent rRNA methyltransferase spb1 n=1 Tax=Apiospora kogelbergensis TaxID=1337665 RepID=A0AAW0QH79_9PEZI
MPFQKKTGKGRLDKWYKLAKEKGFRARAAFKLIQLNKKYGFLEKSRVCLDLCAAPGSWCQVAAQTMPQGSMIIGCDLSPIKPIPNVITFQSDITTDKCRATIRQYLKTLKVDVVLHDGAPNVGTAWVQDSFNQAELTLQSMKLATEFLNEGGTFVTKVFRSKDYNSLLWVFNQLFTKVEATKPPSSRNVSAEIFVVCRGFKAPKKIDPRFLDPKTVFAELAAAAPNNEAKVFNPEIKKRKREGYEEGDYTQFKEMRASEFIQTLDPIAILGGYNKLSFDQPPNGDVALAALDKMPETTEEIRLCCADLRVLGRKEFKLLLRWRLKVRELFGFPTRKTAAQAAESAKQEAGEVAAVEPMDEELKMLEEIEDLKDRDNTKKRREKRKENEKKQKEIVRMQMNMMAPMDIGLEQDGPIGRDSLFALKNVDKKNAAAKIAKGRMAVLKESEKRDHDSGIGETEEDSNDDDEEDRLERELDGMYEQYQDRKSAADAKFRAKKARKEHDDGEWGGVSADEHSSDDGELEQDSDSDDDSDDEDAAPAKKLLTDLDNTPEEEGGLSKRAKSFFNRDIFDGILDGDEDMEEEEEVVKVANGAEEEDDSDAELNAIIKKQAERKKSKADKNKGQEKEKDGFEIVKSDYKEDDDWEAEDNRRSDGQPDIDIITAEAMTLAHQLATGQRTSYDVVDDGFNKHAFRDRDGLPDWFMDDEMKHDKPHKPITKAAANALKEKMRAYNARPIKKVREAKARKKFKTAQRLEKLKKKSDMLANDENMTEKEKAESIGKLMSKAAKKKPKENVRVVVAKGVNRGIQGRPQGVKGRYKIVDPRMKKEMRAERRVAKKRK